MKGNYKILNINTVNKYPSNTVKYNAVSAA